MKKFIAILVALTMIAAVGMTCVFAAEPTNIEVVCNVPTTPSTLSNGNLRYDITFKLNGITGNQLSWAGEFDDDEEIYYDFEGRSIDSIGLNLYVTGAYNEGDIVSATLKNGGGYYTSGSVLATTFDGLAVEASGDRLYPSGEGSGTLNTNSSPFVTIRVTTKPGVVVQLIPQGTIEISNWSAGVVESNNVYSNETGSNLTFSESPIVIGTPSTVDVTSVTISGATNATVGDNVQLTAAVLPDNATDKTVTWTKVSGEGAVSAAGVVTATAAGDVVVKATAGGVDSANYTVSFAAAAPADIVPDAADKDTYSNASAGLKDAFGQDVTIDSSRSYGAAKFDNVVLDDGEYVYKVFATGVNKTTGEEETNSWDVVDGSVEITGANVSFIAIVRSATRTITSVVLKAFAK